MLNIFEALSSIPSSAKPCQNKWQTGELIKWRTSFEGMLLSNKKGTIDSKDNKAES